MHSERLTGLKVNDRDNVATLFCSSRALCNVEIVDRQGRRMSVTLTNDIPYGHKIHHRHTKGRGHVSMESRSALPQPVFAPGSMFMSITSSTRGRGDWEEEAESR